VEQRARRAKTDRIDGELLLRTLMAYLRGEPRVVRIVRVPTVEQEDARRASRERDRLVTEQTAHTNRIKALLRLLGVAVGNPRRSDWLSWLQHQRDRQGHPANRHGSIIPGPANRSSLSRVFNFEHPKWNVFARSA